MSNLKILIMAKWYHLQQDTQNIQGEIHGWTHS